MSRPAVSLPPEVAELMTTGITWEAATALDMYGQASFAAGVTLYCFCEPVGLKDTGVDIERGKQDWVINPSFILYFDGDDSRVRSFTSNDRFTFLGYQPYNLKSQPDAITPIYGPNFDNQNPWLVEVTMSAA